MSRAVQLAQEARAISDAAFDQGRELTPSEREKVTDLLKRANESKGLEAQMRELDGDGAFQRGQGNAPNGPLGDQFVKSEGYKGLMARGLGSGQFSTGPIDLEVKTTLTETPGTALVQAGYQPGVVSILSQANTIADLMPQPQAPGNPVRFVQESTATNAAAPTAELGLKPESTLAFSEVSEPIRKIATYLPISDELLEDAPQIQAYLNARLSLFVQSVEDTQLLLGNGTAPNLQGFIASGRAIGTFTRSAGTANELAILKAAVGTRGSSFLTPDTVVIHPTNYQAIRAGTDASGQYYGGGPFYGPYGGAQGPAGLFGGDRLWNMNVVVTSNITVGTALLGNFSQGAAVFRKGGLRVEASNSHSTFFQTNTVAIRAEERLALCVYRPTAFTAVVGLQ